MYVPKVPGFQCSSSNDNLTVAEKMTDILELRGHLLKQDRKDNHAS